MDTGSGTNATTGAAFGKYRIVRKLGAGAFGSVFEALLAGPMGFSKKVAIKKLHSKLVEEDPKFVQSMVNEARIGGLLHHANIVDVIEFGHVGKHYFLAMEFVDGATLEEIVKICRRRQVLLPRFAIVDLAIQVCRGLYHAHNLKDHQGNPLHIIHRDLKPSNIIVDREGTAKICDFGIAKAASNLYQTTATGMVKGTPRYMSPEQITGDVELTPASDIFSLGAVLHEVITGKILFHAESFPQLIHRIVSVDVTRDLDAAEAAFPGSRKLLERALAKDPADRYPDARALAADLRELGHSYPAEADMAEVIERLLPEVDRTDVREIESSRDLDLDASLSDSLDTEIGAVSAAASIAPADPASTGWQRFSSMLPGGEGPPSSGAMTPVNLSDAVQPSLSQDDETQAITGQVAPRRRPGWHYLAGIALLLLIGVAVGVVKGLGDTETGDETTPVSEVMTEEEVTGTVPPPPEPAKQEEPTPEPTPEPQTEEPLPAEPATEEPAEPEPVEEPVEETPPSYRPGTVSLYSRPWAEIYVDGSHVVSANALKEHGLEGGPHSIHMVCPSKDGRQKTFEFFVDGNAVNLGCWDFESMGPCTREE